MRILTIRLKNLNSLVGEWEVDFTAPDYTADGIFAITGPTGAGKTTLLDAICLALYGKTPRLDNITQSSNEIMSRQTGECFAEVTFSTQQGTFRCHWSQHRARKNTDGKLQVARHEIVDAISGKVIDNQLRSVTGRIVKATGMDFRRFTQSMMLAQGGFAEFLRASADERAPILEQITGTAIYSDISRQVHLRHGEVRSAQQMLEAELKGMNLLSTEQEAGLRMDEQRITIELKHQQQLEADTRRHYDWKKLCLELQMKAESLQQQYTRWQMEFNAFAPQRDVLAAALQALELSAGYASLHALRTEQDYDRLQLADAERDLPMFQQQALEAVQRCQSAARSQQAAEQSLRDMRPVLTQVHLLDQQINQATVHQQAVQQDLLKRQSDCKSRQGSLNDLQRESAKKKQQLLSQYPLAANDPAQITKIAQDQLRQLQQRSSCMKSALDELLLARDIRSWRQEQEQIEAQRTQLSTLRERLQQRNILQETIESLQHSNGELTGQLKALAESLDDSAALVKAHARTLAALRQQQAQQQRILSLEQQRQQLLDGEPCPLCGSIEHPFADHQPAPNDLQSDLDQTQIMLQSAQQRLDELGKLQVKLQTQCDHNNQQLNRETDNISRLNAAIVAMQQKLQLYTENLTAQHLDVHAGTLEQELERIKRTVNAADHLLQDISKLEQQQRETLLSINEIQSTLKDLEYMDNAIAEQLALMAALEAEMGEVGQNLQQLQATGTVLRDKRIALLGSDDPYQTEAALESALTAAQADLQQQQQMQVHLENELHSRRQSIGALQQRITQRVEVIRAKTDEFNSQLTAQGFRDEHHFLDAQLDDLQRRKLQQDNEQLNRRGIELQSAIQQNQLELNTQLSLNLGDASLDFLASQLSALERSSSQLQEQLGAVRQGLRNNAELRLRQQDLVQKIDAQKTETARWGRLHELIGSADGKKFRNFAQGLTFDMLIAHANQQLQKMSERYLLQRDETQALDLNVIDNFQAGETRSTKNLSGGESFIVSLALALGLSRMASHNVRVDSLFLDEGFGTLDEDALDTALDTLSSLQQEGKLIGMISHVSALKERIATQIKVSPVAGGRSRLSGPGCRQL
jgi:DNA repair protein SbcC/Rad50